MVIRKISDLRGSKGVQLKKDVFVVHGHNEGLRESVARFLEKVGLKAIILHEQPNSGRTIIEKFEDHSNVSFAVVLLTADDVGRKKADLESANQFRARQNVIFELGFFIGKLGRRKVCAIYETGVELPSDYQGNLYVNYDAAGSWKLLLAKELKSGGVSVDLNKVT